MFALGHMDNQQAALKEQNRALADLRKMIKEIFVEKKKAEDKLLELHADMECESTAYSELKEELSRLQKISNLPLRGRMQPRLTWSSRGLPPKRIWMNSGLIWNRLSARGKAEKEADR